MNKGRPTHWSPVEQLQLLGAAQSGQRNGKHDE